MEWWSSGLVELQVKSSREDRWIELFTFGVLKWWSNRLVQWLNGSLVEWCSVGVVEI